VKAAQIMRGFLMPGSLFPSRSGRHAERASLAQSGRVLRTMAKDRAVLHPIFALAKKGGIPRRQPRGRRRRPEVGRQNPDHSVRR
jgi:hypothetical protein